MLTFEDFARDVRGNYRSVAEFTVEDAQLRRFQYHLLRLSSMELSREEIPDLLELGRLVFQGSDATSHLDKIRQRPGLSPLAAAIADIVAEGGRLGDHRAVLLGAVLGAYTTLIGAGESGGEKERHTAAIVGAIAGAAALSTGAFILENLGKIGSAEYFRAEQ